MPAPAAANLYGGDDIRREAVWLLGAAVGVGAGGCVDDIVRSVESYTTRDIASRPAMRRIR